MAQGPPWWLLPLLLGEQTPQSPSLLSIQVPSCGTTPADARDQWPGYCRGWGEGDLGRGDLGGCSQAPKLQAPGGSRSRQGC